MYDVGDDIGDTMYTLSADSITSSDIHCVPKKVTPKFKSL